VSSKNDDSAAQVVLTPLEWSFVKPGTEKGVHVPSVVRHWHRAGLLGFELERLSVGRAAVDPVALERLKMFLAGGGGWELASKDYWEARRVLEGILVRRSV